MPELSQLHITEEQEYDFAIIQEINRLAFGREDEAALVARLTRLGDKRISLVAKLNEEVVGHILFTPLCLEGAPTLNAYGLAPMSVLPAKQRQGVGGALIKAGLEECAKRGLDAVFVLGHNSYYPRFGFVLAGEMGFHYESIDYASHFFVYPLKPENFIGKSSWECYDPAFNEL